MAERTYHPVECFRLRNKLSLAKIADSLKTTVPTVKSWQRGEEIPRESFRRMQYIFPELFCELRELEEHLAILDFRAIPELERVQSRVPRDAASVRLPTSKFTAMIRAYDRDSPNRAMNATEISGAAVVVTSLWNLKFLARVPLKSGGGYSNRYYSTQLGRDATCLEYYRLRAGAIETGKIVPVRLSGSLIW